MTVLAKSESDAQNHKEDIDGLQFLEDMGRVLLAEVEGECDSNVTTDGFLIPTPTG